LLLVKKYLLGQFLKNSDGAFAMMDRFLFLKHFHLSQDYYETYIKKIEAVSAERLLELSQKHLNWEEFTIISAG
jgi:predicted Zn-dependent peptidase